MLNGHKPLRAFFLHQQFRTAIRPSACRISSFLGFYYLRASAASTMRSDSQNLFFSNHLFVCGKLMSEPSRPHVPLKVQMRMTCAVYMFMTMIGCCLRYKICPQSRIIIWIICCLYSNRHTLIIQPHGKSQKTIILC